ncbi:MAG: aspartate:alanine exchanger family transporter [Pseudomonadales bacterium]
MDLLENLYQLLKQQPVLTLFIILGFGYVIGGIRLGSFSLGSVAGVLFVGLFFGHFGFRISPGAQAVGFALFIFSVGYQAGPRFFDVVRTDGLKYFSLALVIALSGFAMATLGAWWLELKPGTSAGLLAGGLTSSPTLAAAQEAIRAGTVSAPEGWTADAVIGNITTGYAITYIFGLAGLIAIIKLLPGVLKIDLKAEAKRLEAGDQDGITAAHTSVSSRAYEVSNEAFTQATIGELRERLGDGFAVGRLRRDGQFITPDPDEYLRLGDELFVMGEVALFTPEVQSVGKEITAQENMSDITDSAQVIVTNPVAVGKSLDELDINRTYQVLVTDVRRMRISVPKDRSMQLRKGDILTVLGARSNIDYLGQELGQVERDVAETDMITFAFGIAAGVVLGLFSVKIGGVSVGLGSAGGMLASGLIIGFLRSVRPTFGRMPDAARWIFMEFGLLIFMAGVGLRAGGDIIQTLLNAGPQLMIAGILVTTIPVFLGYVFGRRVLKLNPVILLGAITGAMTSGASLSVITKEADSNVPALGYTGSYAFANVLLTVAGSVILLI